MTIPDSNHSAKSVRVFP